MNKKELEQDEGKLSKTPTEEMETPLGEEPKAPEPYFPLEAPPAQDECEKLNP